MKYLALLGTLLLAGCNTGPTRNESDREIVLQYVGGEVGTAGPFSKKAARELDILAEPDRSKSVALLERGAVAFFIYQKTAGAPAAAKSAAGSNPASGTRVIVVHNRQIVGDFRAP